jgi:hypothetical protein
MVAAAVVRFSRIMGPEFIVKVANSGRRVEGSTKGVVLVMDHATQSAA